METLALLIESDEKEHYPMLEISGEEMLQFLMEQNALMPSDLPEIGHPQLVSEFLNGQRYLNTQQIRTLRECFHVSPAVFYNGVDSE